MECSGLLNATTRWQLAAWALLIAAAFACGSEEPTNSPAPAEEVKGVVLEVESRSILELASLKVQDDVGGTWHFVARGFQGFTPSHLREHMVLGAPVTVVFRRDGDQLVIVEITDRSSVTK